MNKWTKNIFRYLYRFNIVVVASLGLLGIFGIFSVLFSIVDSRIKKTKANPPIRVEENQQGKREFYLGRAHPLDGTPIMNIPIHTKKYTVKVYSGSIEYADYKESQIVNYLFVEQMNKISQRLFATNDQVVLSQHVLRERPYTSREYSFEENFSFSTQKPKSKIVKLIYEMVEKDTNHDKQLDEHDRITLAASAVDGTGYQKFLENIDRIESLQQITDHLFFVVYRKDQQFFSETFEIDSLKSVGKQNISMLHFQ